MAITDHPTRPEPNLFLHAGIWQVACAECGAILTEHRWQQVAERRARRVTCPICRGGTAA
jgi:ribosomal protein S27E